MTTISLVTGGNRGLGRNTALSIARHSGDVILTYRNGAEQARSVVAEIEALAALPEIAPLVDGWETGERLIRAGLGRSRIRPMFADARPHPPERAIRKRLRAEGLWLA